MIINFQDYIKEVKEKHNIDITPADYGAALLSILLDNNKAAYTITQQPRTKFIDENNNTTRASLFFKTKKMQVLTELLKPIALNICSEVLKEEEVKESGEKAKEEIKKGGLTTERLKSLIEELILKSYNRDENKEFLDALKIYISKFEVENKTKQNFITILPKIELKSCPHCKKEI